MAIKAFHNLVKISADSQGNAPKTIELLRTGTWNTPWHGEFEITPDDIQQFVINANQGVGLVEADPKIPLNYGHDSWDKAAGWMPKLYASEDGAALLADPEWTPAAEQAIKDGEWKYISPEFNPRSYPWEDPEQEYNFVSNVLTGAALTNIPLFKKLKPITASRLPNKKVKASAAGNSEKNNEGEHMTLEDIRAKQVADLTEDEKSFLAEHKADLTAEELTAFGLEADDEAKAAAEKEAADKAAAEEAEKADADAKAAEEAKATEEAAKIEASAKPVTINADRLAKLEADAAAGREASQKLQQSEASAFASARITAGQIKSGQKDQLVKILLASRGDDRKTLETFLAALPENKLVTNGEIGDGGAAVVADAGQVVHERVQKVLADARTAGKPKSYADARKEVLDADETLKDQLKEEQ
ncbi:phage protease [Pseudarthrobacter sp. ATCC 49987]|uniref:phage protease n=1 Tax=Pseudarthrobacter sp. ATCC 49987 TaxID=2698204 RepID=UPI00136CE10B|nr:phage protease [Pseudarthrobacter sp. ATCC 49987]